MKTITLKECRELLDVSDIMEEFADYGSGYICDVISEVSDSNVSIYTQDQIEYCRNNPDAVEDALFEGLAMQPLDFFKTHGGDYEDYEAHLGACAQFLNLEEELNESFNDAIAYQACKEIYKETKKPLCFEAVEEMQLEEFDNSDRLEDAIESLRSIYNEFLEELESVE